MCVVWCEWVTVCAVRAAARVGEESCKASQPPTRLAVRTGPFEELEQRSGSGLHELVGWFGGGVLARVARHENVNPLDARALLEVAGAVEGEHASHERRVGEDGFYLGEHRADEGPLRRLNLDGEFVIDLVATCGYEAT
jgi:hypothetical protein